MTEKSKTKPSLSDLTVQQILNVMRPTGEVLAVGKYQAIPITFKAWISAQNISTTAVFTSELQEKLGDWLISGKRPKVAQYVFGSNSVSIENAQLELAKEFASVPVPYKVTRPKGAAGKTDPGAILEPGQSYYFGVAGNRAVASSEKYQTALKEARRVGSLEPLKQFIARGEGNYDALNRGIAGDTSTYSTEYYNALFGEKLGQAAPRTGPAVMIDATGYIDQVYKQPFRDVKPSQAGVVNSEARNAGTFSQEYQNFLNTLQMDSQSTDKKRNGLLILDDTIKGDLQLIAGLASAQVASEAKVTHIAGTILSTYSLTAKQDLVTSQIFEMNPDRMRLKMAQNAEISTTNNSSHAWRAPGKLSITADITIPGTAGFRMGQIFWIDRIVENYKKFGAFQIFGISEHIDISKGWTTTLHSRFNALPRKLLDQKILYDDEAPSNPTLNNPTQATPTNP